MNTQQALELGAQILQLQSLMIAFVADGRTKEQPAEYRELFAWVQIGLEASKYAHPNPHRSLEVFSAFCKLQEMKTYASRRTYVEELYSDILLDLKRIQAHKPTPKNWAKANDALSDELSLVRVQWLKAKNFIVAAAPDFENSVKESISSVESCLMILLKEPNGTLGKLIKRAGLDEDIERLISQAYGFASNKDFVRHGGTNDSQLGKEEAEFFLEFSGSAIVYITTKLKRASTDT
ncbi:hypothetical protein [Undibacterium sp. RuTC16W]|uniref:hypothetical protein n=1 Tax=Undibacterium sp. RuTC16W TaxID=3413048 RepID=UPI003BF1F87C